MSNVIGKLLKDNNMPDTPTARALYRKMLEPDYIRPWVGLTEEDWAAIEDMPESFDQGVVWAQARLKKKNT